LIHYYLKTKLDEKEKVRITILEAAGKVVRELDGPTNAGINQTNWDLRYTRYAEPTEEQAQALAAGFGFGQRGPLVEPGEYTVKVRAGKTEAAKSVLVQEDTRVQISPADRAARRKALTQLYEMALTAERGRSSIAWLRTALSNALEAWKRPDAPKVPEEIRKEAEALSKGGQRQ
jgi:flagellar hook assembly protein FlgD